MSSTINKNVKIISIEGNIGAGKSTIIDKLKDELKVFDAENKVVFIKEPVDIWESMNEKETGKNIIQLFYENPEKWSFAFQIMVFITQKKLIEDTLEKYPNVRIIVSERSIEAGHNVFTEMLKEHKNINTLEKQIYELLYESNPYSLYLSIYLDVPPETCFQRIQQRAREGEIGKTGVNIEYLKECDNYYRNWLIEKKELYESPQIVHIIQNNDLQSVLNILVSLI